jgi:hypothetical protein
LLEEIKEHGRVWGDLAEQYGVTNPDPPWKTSLDGMCEVLGIGFVFSMDGGRKALAGRRIVARDVMDAPLPLLERRWEEDELSATLYQDVPFPERQLLALTHSLIKRGLVIRRGLEGADEGSPRAARRYLAGALENRVHALPGRSAPPAKSMLGGVGVRAERSTQQNGAVLAATRIRPGRRPCRRRLQP